MFTYSGMRFLVIIHNAARIVSIIVIGKMVIGQSAVLHYADVPEVKCIVLLTTL